MEARDEASEGGSSGNLITEEYRKLNEQLHEDNKDYGTSGRRYVKDIMNLATKLKTQDLLDYGCGKSTLQQNIPFKIQQYDPAVTKYKALPEPADVVVCTDVLEHIEPDLIDNVLAHIAKMTNKAAYLVANTQPAMKTLPDGRNSHILLRSPKWWIDIVDKYFDIMTFLNQDLELVFVVKKKGIELDEQKAKEQNKNGQVAKRTKTSTGFDGGEKLSHGSTDPTHSGKQPKPASDFYRF